VKYNVITNSFKLHRASPESQISRQWWCLSKGAVLEWVGGDLVQCAVMGSPEAEVGVGEREVCCGLWEREEGKGNRACVGGWVGGVYFLLNQKIKNLTTIYLTTATLFGNKIPENFPYA
jgi:hypothetical protein